MREWQELPEVVEISLDSMDISGVHGTAFVRAVSADQINIDCNSQGELVVNGVRYLCQEGMCVASSGHGWTPSTANGRIGYMRRHDDMCRHATPAALEKATKAFIKVAEYFAKIFGCLLVEAQKRKLNNHIVRVEEQVAEAEKEVQAKRDELYKAYQAELAYAKAHPDPALVA